MKNFTILIFFQLVEALNLHLSSNIYKLILSKIMIVVILKYIKYTKCYVSIQILIKGQDSVLVISTETSKQYNVNG
jgi:hypothetical protein